MPAAADPTPEPAPRRASFRQIAQAFTQQLGARAVGMIASFLTMSLTTRYLGPESYGHLTTAIVFVGMWLSLTELGVGAVIVRRVSSGNGDLSRLVRVNSGMSIAYCLPLTVLAALSGIIVYGGDPAVVPMLLIVCGSLALTSIGNCFEPVFLATVRFGAVALSDVVSRVCTLVGTLVLVNTQASVVWFALVQLVPPAVMLLVQGIAARRIVRCTPVFDVRESWDLLRESLPQTGVLIIAVLYWRVDGFILTLLSTPTQVGVYGMAYTLAFTLSVIATFLGTSTLSTMTNLYAESRERFAEFVTRSIETMMFVALPIVVLGGLAAPAIVLLIASDEFVADGAPTLALLFAAVGVTFLNTVLSQALFAAHDQVFLLRLNCVNLLINIGLNLVLAPRFGAVGAGASLVVVECIGLVVVSWRLHTRSPYRTPWRFVTRLALPALVALLAFAVLRSQSVWLAAGVAGSAYLATNLVLGPISLSVVKSIVRREGVPA